MNTVIKMQNRNYVTEDETFFFCVCEGFHWKSSWAGLKHILSTRQAVHQNFYRLLSGPIEVQSVSQFSGEKSPYVSHVIRNLAQQSFRTAVWRDFIVASTHFVSNDPSLFQISTINYFICFYSFCLFDLKYNMLKYY